MTLMKTIIKANHLYLTPSISEYIEMKIGSLDKFIKRFEDKGDVKVEVEIARTTRHHRHGNVFYAEANLYLGKHTLRAEHYGEDIRIAVDKIKDKLKQEIKKYKEKKIEIRQPNKKIAE